MDRIVIRGGRIVDPESGRDEIGDILIEGDRIVQVGRIDPISPSTELEFIEAAGLLVTPGLIDMHVHLREPGNEEEETISSGAQAAVAGYRLRPETDGGCLGGIAGDDFRVLTHTVC